MSSSVIGWIKPDDGERIDGRLLDYECFQLTRWLADRGRQDLVVDVELTDAEALHTPEDLMATGDLKRLLPPARRLAQRGADMVAWVCTSGSFVGGRKWAEQQVDVLEAETGKKAISTSLAIVQALDATSSRTVDLLSPYPKPLTDTLLAFLSEHGLQVRQTAVLNCPTGGDSHRIDLVAEVKRFAQSIPGERLPILIPDTAINTLDLGRQLEQAAQRPVITANQATLWCIANILGRPIRLDGGGSLLAGSSTLE